MNLNSRAPSRDERRIAHPVEGKLLKRKVQPQGGGLRPGALGLAIAI
jgi:hypothetical protein